LLQTTSGRTMNNPYNPLAEQLNRDIAAANNCVSQLLSERGLAIFFPSKGILGQTAEAKGCAINATIGTAFEDDGSPLCLGVMTDQLNVPSTSFLYAPSYGNPDIRDAWAEMMREKNPSLGDKPVSRPVVASALTHALSIAAYLLVDEGDELIIPDFYWGNYNLLFANAFGCKFRTFTTFSEGGFNMAGLKEALNAPGEKKLVLLNFPNNPTGYTATEEEAAQICDLLREAADAGKQIAVLLDDAYFGLVYEAGVAQESLFSTLADIHENVLAVKLDGPTKEDYVWGFRVGFITFGCKNATQEEYRALEAKAAGAIRGGISNCSNIGQQILLEGYKNPSYLQQKREKFETLRRRYARIRDLLAAHPEWETSFLPLPFNSGYFMCVRPIDVDAETVRVKLLAEYDTGVIVQSGVIRIAFSATPLDKIDMLFDNLHAAIQALQS
jgi:aspartate/methionine/tyrosine aminotransferase